MRHSLLPVPALLVLLAAPPAPAADRAAYTPEQLSLIRTTTECQLSPDGRTVAFTSTMTGAVELWTVPVGGGWPTQLTNRNEFVSEVRWSPDGRWIVFACDYSGNARPDLFRVPGGGGQVEKLTDTKLAHNEPRFSPDGKRLAFTADPDEPFVFQLHVMDLATRKVTRLTREKVKVQVPVWSPDGKTIAINRSGDDEKGDLLLVDVATGSSTVIQPALKGGNPLPVRFSQDGKTLLLLDRNKAGFKQLAVLGVEPSGQAGKPPRPAGRAGFFGPGDWDVTAATWHKKGIYFVRNEGGAAGLYFAASPQDKIQTLLPAEGWIQQLHLDAAGDTLALLKGDVRQPADVWVLSRSKKPLVSAAPDVRPWSRPRQVTFSLLGGVRAGDLSKGEMVSYKSFDGRKIHALVLKPRVARLGVPPPAVVYVHGGPDSQVTLSWRTTFHLLTEAGFVVIAPNFRGSTGYGKAFEDANNKDWGGGDLKDVIEAVKYFAKRGDIDGKRVGITGGSFGGYLTLMALGRAPDVFRAGVELYGMPDLVMDYYLAKTRFADWYHTEMGNPKTDAALFRERSPLLYLDDIKAPLLIFQGAGDTSVPKPESDLLAAVLKELKKDYQYIVYDDEGHGFFKRKNLLDYYRRTTKFFVKHLKPKK